LLLLFLWEEQTNFTIFNFGEASVHSVIKNKTFNHVCLIMKLENNWQQKTLETLENKSWGNTLNAPTNPVKRCINLAKIPIVDFSLSDLRLMIGQQFALDFLIPLALEKLQDNILIEADFYEGDLLSSVLNVDTSFWAHNKDYWIALNNLISDKRQQLVDVNISTTKFDNA